jgi:hypothetical protein
MQRVFGVAVVAIRKVHGQCIASIVEVRNVSFTGLIRSISWIPSCSTIPSR